MSRIPVALITIWHPEAFWGIQARELRVLPAIKKKREEEELYKAEIAKEKCLSTTREEMHGRPIINMGRSTSYLRRTWLNGIDLCGVMADYSLRLIHTEETGTQAPFKVEVRPNWGAEPNILPDELVFTMKTVFSKSKLSIRQLWENPFTIGTDWTPNRMGKTVNLVIGPYDEIECFRKADIRFVKHSHPIDIHQHCPSYRRELVQERIHILSGCNIWWAEYN